LAAAPAPGSDALYEPAEHRPLAGAPWSEAVAREAIASIAADAVAAYRGTERLWPNHPADVDEEDGDDPERPYRSVYLGAAGMAWALHRLAAEDLGPELPGLAELSGALHDDYLAAPELTELDTGHPPPPPSLLFGESGILLALEAIGGPGAERRRDALAACVATNARNPTREPCWGSPGTMVAAQAMWHATRDPRWRELWRESARWLLAEWSDPIWMQDMYGQQCRYIGAGHGFAGNAAALLAGIELLGEAGPPAVDRIARTAAALAVGRDGLAQWPGLADTTIERRPVQWCHGSPGIVVSLRALPADPDTDRLLAAGAELTWRAGPLRKGVGLCHGTAGNAFALLALHARTGEPRWLDRARAFAVDAVAEVTVWREHHGRGRYTLFTGDIGVALLLRACLTGEAGFPFLDDAL
jgi:hypothetical protein